MTSTQTQIPYDYYSFPFCHPPNGVHHYGENLGEFLTGDRIENSPYEVQMKVDQSCTVLCARAINQCVRLYRPIVVDGLTGCGWRK